MTKKIGILCIGNKLLMDDGLAIALYEELVECYDFTDDVEIFDVGCMSMYMVGYVEKFDLLITVDALDGTDEVPGTVFEFEDYDMERSTNTMQLLHDLKLVVLLDAAKLLGHDCDVLCFGMQVENANPDNMAMYLSAPVCENLPLLVEAVLAALLRNGAVVTCKSDGSLVIPGHRHLLSRDHSKEDAALHESYT